MKDNHSTGRKLALICIATIFAASILVTIWLTSNSPEKTPAVNAAVAETKRPAGFSSTTSLTQPLAEPEPATGTASNSAPLSITKAIPLDGSEVVLEAKGTTTKLTGSDGLFDRLFVSEKVPLEFTLTLPNLVVGKEILITAPNGGNLTRKDGPLTFKAESNSAKIVLNFVPSIGRGVYTIRIQHRGESQIIDLWAGPRNPLGQPGPAYVQQPAADSKI